MYMVEYIVKIHTTRLYNTPIQHANKDIKRKKKLAFIEVEKEGTYIWVGLGFSFFHEMRRLPQ